MFSSISRWYHHIWCILYTSKVIKGNAMHMLPGLLGVACSPIISVSLEEKGCEPVLNLAATPDEAVSIMCTFVDKTIPSTFGEVDVCEPYYRSVRIFNWASWRCSSFYFSLGLLTWLFYAYGMCCQDDVAPGEFLLIKCACIFLDWALQLMCAHDQLMIDVS